MWDKSEKRFLLSLNSHEKIQNYLDHLAYNPDYTVASPRYSILTNSGHCFEGCLIAASALELQGFKPLIVNLHAHNDDDHALTVYKTKSGWGSFSKSNTTLLSGRRPVFRTVRELVLSYFDFYFNLKGELSLYGYSNPVNLNQFNSWNWRTSEVDLIDLSLEISKKPFLEIVSVNELKKMKPVPEKLKMACFLGADPSGLYRV